MKRKIENRDDRDDRDDSETRISKKIFAVSAVSAVSALSALSKRPHKKKRSLSFAFMSHFEQLELHHRGYLGALLSLEH